MELKATNDSTQQRTFCTLEEIESMVQRLSGCCKRRNRKFLWSRSAVLEDEK